MANVLNRIGTRSRFRFPARTDLAVLSALFWGASSVSWASCVLPPGMAASQTMPVNVYRCIRVTLTNDYNGNFTIEGEHGEQTAMLRDKRKAKEKPGTTIQGYLISGDRVKAGVTPTQDINLAMGGGDTMLFVSNAKDDWECPIKVPNVVRFEVKLRCCDMGPVGACMLPGQIAIGVPLP